MEQPDWRRALSAQSEVLAYMTGPHGDGMSRTWVNDRLHKYGPSQASGAAFAFGHCVEDLIASEPLYVTGEMQDLVYEAMETFDASETMHWDDLFLREGFALLERPFYGTDVNGKRLCWRAVQWRYHETPTQLVQEDGSLDEAKTEPVLAMILWSHIDDVDDYPLSPELIAHSKSQGIWWGVAHATAIPFWAVNDPKEMSGEGDPNASWMKFFRVTQRLMAEKIVSKHKRRVDRPSWRKARRLGLDIRDVVVVELRREAEPTKPKGSTANYSHRFLRRYHWRNQYYPASGTHRQKFIHTTVVGDDSLPLIVKKRVWQWDR